MDQSTNNFLIVGDDNNLVFDHFNSTLKTIQKEHDKTSKKLDVTVETKYYTANIRLHSFVDLRTLAIWRSQNKDVQCRSFCLILKKSQTAFDLNKLEALLELFDFDTKMIACYQSCLPISFTSSLTLWTNKNGFELIDLEPDDSAVEYFKSNNERYSVDRILEVIESTEWHTKKNKKNPLNQQKKNSVGEELSELSTDEEFDGELDDEEKRFLEELMSGPSILDYYAGKGYDFKTNDGEMSQIEEEEVAEKKAKQKEKARKKKEKEKLKVKVKDNEDASDDVEIELDKDEPKREDKTKPLEGAELMGRINELRETIKDKPRETRIDMAEMFTNAIMKCFDEE